MKIIEKKKIYFGIELLRFLFCLWIVIIHCSTIKPKHKKYFDKGFHVPSFFLISFYFFYHQMVNRIIPKIISRFERLLFPYILWPIVILILNNVLFILFKIGEYNTKITLKDFYIQIIIGARYHAIFWFQFNIIFISLILTIISFLSKNNIIIIIDYLAIICIYLHFTGINYNIFISFNRIFQITLGGLVELIPLAIIGCILSSLNILIKIQISSIHYYMILFFFILLLFKFDIFKFYSGLRYPNIFLNIVASITLFITFGTINIKQSMIKKLITNITKFTGGIYCIHPIFRRYLQKYNTYLFLLKNHIFHLVLFISYVILLAL